MAEKMLAIVGTEILPVERLTIAHRANGYSMLVETVPGGQVLRVEWMDTTSIDAQDWYAFVNELREEGPCATAR